MWIGENENPAVVARLPNKELLRTPKGDRLVGQVLLAARLVGTSVNDIKHWPFPVNIGIHLAEDDARSKIELSEVSLADVGMIQPLFE